MFVTIIHLKPIRTRAAIGADFVDAGCIVDTLVIHAVVVVHFTAEP